MCHDPFSRYRDSYMGDVDPDTFLQGSLGLNIPNSNYYFPDTPIDDLDQLTAHTFSVINFNVGSIPKHFDTYLDQCISPFNWKFDVLSFCETKLTNNIDNLYDIPTYSRYCNNLSRHFYERIIDRMRFVFFNCVF